LAGIAGIITRHPGPANADLEKAFVAMMKEMAVTDRQECKSHIVENVCFGNVLPVSSTNNNCFQHNEVLGICAAAEGLVFVDSYERALLAERYDIEKNLPDCAFIPFLFDFYRKDFAVHITGWFNIFIYDGKSGQSYLVNDRLGFLPLYYYESELFFIFASKIEAILSTGLLPGIQPDITTVAEHLFFNYPVSDHTYIENILTLPAAQFVTISEKRFIKEKYWSFGEIFDYAPAGRKKSLDFIDEGLRKAVSKITTRWKDKINFSLTGGWDSRVVLSYLLPDCKDRIHAYSFGARQAPDVLIPMEVARAEGLEYTPYILDQSYLDHDFLPNAIKTIELSGGTRNYKRTHYLYAVKEISGVSDLLITGIFGDEVFKVAGPLGGEVLSGNMIDLLGSDFDLVKMINKFNQSYIPGSFNIERKILIEGFRHRLEHLKESMSGFDSVSKKYYSFRFETNLRKYFGHEANSYNDYVYCFSPFIDADFLDHFARTRYFGIHYPFGSKSILLKKQSTQLYHDIVKVNYGPLLHYNSARGYSMSDANNLLGRFKAIYKNYFRKRHNIDGFNTNPTDNLFHSFLKSQNLDYKFFIINTEKTRSFFNPNLLSLLYWFGVVEKKYSK